MALDITQEDAQKIHNELVKANQLAAGGRRSEAKAICLSVYDLCPDYPDTNQILGLLLSQEFDFHKAADHFQRAVSIFPEQPFVWMKLAQTYLEIRQPLKAKEALKTTLKYQPGNGGALTLLGDVTLALGDSEGAKRIYHQALEADPAQGRAWRQFAKLATPKEAKDIQGPLEQRIKDAQGTPALKSGYVFALGTCLDKSGETGFAQDLWTASRAFQTTNPGWRDHYQTTFEKTKEVFTTDLLKRAPGEVNSSFQPIFIVGLPRTGSTLLEHILASDPKVFGGDEVRFSEGLFQNLETLLPHKPYPSNIPDLTDDHLKTLSETYQKNMQSLDSGKTVFVDKMLSNFHILGLLRILFPNAKVLNMKRNLDDVAASALKTLQSLNAAPYLTSLADFGYYTTLYEDLMDFWKRLMPDLILDVAYEDLIQNPEKTAKEVFDFCNLKFTKSALNLSKTKRAVYSPSATQVRDKINEKGLRAAEGLEGKLEPFRLVREGVLPLPRSESVKERLQEAGDQIKNLNLDEAQKICEGLLEADPHQAMAMKGLGAIALERQDLQKAIFWYKKSLDFLPAQPDVWADLGESYLTAARQKEAAHAFFMSTLYDPENVRGLFWQAHALAGLGDHVGAKQKLDQVLAIDKNFTAAYPLYLSLEGAEILPAFIDQLETLAESQTENPEGAITALYALARYYKGRDREKFLVALEKANTRQSQMAPEDPDVFEFAGGVAQSHFDEKFFQEKTPNSYKHLTPIFLVGLHRSGSSLLEQILAGHQEIAAGDEIPFLNSVLISELEKTTGKSYPEGIETLTPAEWGEIGEAYQKALKPFSGTKPFATDKMLSNAFFLGPALKAMPWAKVIHIRRNFLDTAFSIYSHEFNEKLKFTHDFKEMAQYFRNIEATLAHWKALNPKNFLDLKYEDLVENPKGEIAKVLKFIGAGWDDNVLNHQKANRPNKTLSMLQVTKPISKSSIGSWREYEDLLAPLKSDLRDFLDEHGFLKSQR